MSRKTAREVAMKLAFASLFGVVRLGRRRWCM